jgi:hypothetical protein
MEFHNIDPGPYRHFLMEPRMEWRFFLCGLPPTCEWNLVPSSDNVEDTGRPSCSDKILGPMLLNFYFVFVQNMVGN